MTERGGEGGRERQKGGREGETEGREGGREGETEKRGREGWRERELYVVIIIC